MSPPCLHCTAACTLNLETAQRIGMVGSSLVGGAIGAWRASSLLTSPLSMATSRFPLAKLPAAVMGAVTGSQAGSRAAELFFTQKLPPGEGTPWLCISCGHNFRQVPRPFTAPQ
ncbi:MULTISPECIES: hypothetical protein [unclassified Halomonas]|uniref:hypothetical protein n=1 Tax=unclassified Halomonas TaxID=2609666 RepID=UPI000480C19E|nr:MULTISPECIES: hypothetical protein [unclassified Halomonas]PKH59420.1 hypothetical protein CXF94_17140 [Halomonas sp. Choline-3u-9]QGQ70627.1 hypothetical protein FDY98_12610 [Halomonas sp. PA16-9]